MGIMKILAMYLAASAALPATARADVLSQPNTLDYENIELSALVEELDKRYPAGQISIVGGVRNLKAIARLEASTPENVAHAIKVISIAFGLRVIYSPDGNIRLEAPSSSIF